MLNTKNGKREMTKTKGLQVKTDPQVSQVFNSYPQSAQKSLLKLRGLILETATEIEGLSHIEETLKWGEPSYIAKQGSTMRIDWKDKSPNQYAIYFNCNTKLVPTFRGLYRNVFNFEGNRAIVFQMDDEIPERELKNCIRAGLLYHRVKHRLNLGLTE
jgi:hypothetical protein